ncbi:MAG: aryl-alcohol dehydrogenase [Solirubrobacteraceae bacterium]|jgi:aryl-alcohol dehydrogenase|nr:aryl-alcohol dehydrogenase [Solirubrobacteraceae bacterium]
MKATAAVLHDLGSSVSLDEIELDELQDNEVLVKIVGAGICRTDIESMHGHIPLPLPTVLGHEGSGIVEAVGTDVENVAPGDHVALSFGHCRECDQCTNGTPAYCELFAPLNYFGSRMDGSSTINDDVAGVYFSQSSWSTYAIATAANTVKVDKDADLEMLGPLGCGLQTGAGAVINVLKPNAGESIAVFGTGGVGLAGIMAAAALGCDPIIAVDTSNERLALAKELGATVTINPQETKDIVWDIMGASAPGLHHALDTTGLGATIQTALASSRVPSQTVTVGFRDTENMIEIDQFLIMNGRRLQGVIEGDADPQEFIPKLIQMQKDGKFPYEKLVKKYRFDEINEAIADFEAGRVIKPILTF